MYRNPHRARLVVCVVMAVCSAMAIAGAYGMPGPTLLYVGKPAATLCALVLAAIARGAAPRYRRGVVVGMVFSTLGDVFLMLPGDFFAAGLGAFLCAHIAYLVAFTDGIGIAPRRGPFLAYGVIAAAVVALLWPGIPLALRAPVLVYVGVLAAMAAQTAARRAARRTNLRPILVRIADHRRIENPYPAKRKRSCQLQ